MTLATIQHMRKEAQSILETAPANLIVEKLARYIVALSEDIYRLQQENQSFRRYTQEVEHCRS